MPVLLRRHHFEDSPPSHGSSSSSKEAHAARSWSWKILILVILSAAVTAGTRLSFSDQQQTATTTTTTTVASSSTSSKPVTKHAPRCTQEQLDIILQQLPVTKCTSKEIQPRFARCSITRLTRCPDSSGWLEQWYTGDLWNSTTFTSKPFLGINVGCNKAFDAVNMLRMGRHDDTIDGNTWRTAMNNPSKGLCRQEFSIVPLPTEGRVVQPQATVHCLEPLPATVDAIQNAAKATGYSEKGLVIHPVAASGMKPW